MWNQRFHVLTRMSKSNNENLYPTSWIQNVNWMSRASSERLMSVQFTSCVQRVGVQVVLINFNCRTDSMVKWLCWNSWLFCQFPEEKPNFRIKGRVKYRFSCAMRRNDARGWGVIASDILKMRKVIEFQSSAFVVYYKIHFRVLLQHICAGKVSVVIVIDK